MSVSRCNSPDNSFADDVEPPARPTAAEEDRAYIVQEIVWALQQAAANRMPHSHLSHILDSIRRRASRRGEMQLSPSDRATILLAIQNFRSMVDWLFPRADDLDYAERGLSALITVLAVWSGDEVSLSANPHALVDAFDHMRIFQNLCHNLSLESDIKARADRRLIASVEEMVKTALEGTGA